MNVIVVGIGRMGTDLALRLDRQGYEVTAVDRDPAALERLGDRFGGQRVVGVGIDRDVLMAAGIERASALVTCMSSDESNIAVAHIARNIFRVPRVIARLYDTARAETYRRLDIQTVSTTSWGVNRVAELLAFDSLEGVCELDGGNVRIVRADASALVAGMSVRELTAVGEVQIVAVSRDNETFVPTQGTVLQSGDIVYAAVAASATGKFRAMLGLAS